jgi:hypothetical protein
MMAKKKSEALCEHGCDGAKPEERKVKYRAPTAEGRRQYESEIFGPVLEATESITEYYPWFVGRLMTDDWLFGLLLVTGETLVVRRIERLYGTFKGTMWMDVELSQDLPLQGPKNVIIAPTERTSCSVNVDYVIAAFELADT